jgi:hypothetical protein
MFEYDHSLLSLIELHKRGIRKPTELEEVIEGHSFADEEFFEDLGYHIVRFIGFTKASKPIKIACRLDDKSGVLTTLDARIPLVEEIIRDFCKYC